jgi:hypothetical protein
MISQGPQTKFERFVAKIQFKLIFFLVYAVSLVGTFIHRLAIGHHPATALVSVGIVHLLFILIVGLVYFLPELFMFFFSPVFLVMSPIQHFLARRYLRRFEQNQPSEVVIILGHPDWYKLEGWLKPIFFKSEMEWLVKYLRTKKQDFSFYPNASFEDVEKIMSDKAVKEVYFYGHGTSHEFELATGEALYYCEFNDPKYRKTYAHQVHCGTRQGKSLIDYIVPPENRTQCFFFRKPINAPLIIREFKRRTSEVRSHENPVRRDS